MGRVRFVFITVFITVFAVWSSGAVPAGVQSGEGRPHYGGDAGGAACAAPSAMDDGWTVSAPAAEGFDAEALCAVLMRIDEGEDNIHGIIVERHGHLVGELYRSGSDTPIDIMSGFWFSRRTDFGPAVLHDTRSVSKSIVGLLFGIAREEGWAPALDAAVPDLYPDIAERRPAARDAVTVESLLTMSSGLDWDEGALPNDETHLFWTSSIARHVLDRPAAARPMTVFNYNSGGTAILADLLERESGKRISVLADEFLFKPLGIGDRVWARDLRGRDLAFTGLRLRPRDMAKIGRLVLDGGSWHGRQVVPAGWVEASLQPRISTGLKNPRTGELQYGYQWWAGELAWRDGTVRWNAAFGNGGQRIFIVPALDLQVVMTAGDYGSHDIAAREFELLEDIVSAARP